MSARYVAIITDGNGRWAQQRGLPVLEGHQAGADVVKERLRDAVDLGVQELTVYSFSTENWNRAPEARLLTVTPFDKSAMKSIEKSIRDSDVGLNPSNDGNLIRLSVPELTEERRRDLVKTARHIAEEGRVGIRNVRRDIMHDLRELKSEGEVGADDEKRAESELQKATDEKVHQLDELLKAKEAEILEV